MYVQYVRMYQGISMKFFRPQNFFLLATAVPKIGSIFTTNFSKR